MCVCINHRQFSETRLKYTIRPYKGDYKCRYCNSIYKLFERPYSNSYVRTFEPRPPVKLYGIEINNMGTGAMMVGESVAQGALKLIVSKQPNIVYKQYGNILVGSGDGFYRAFQIKSDNRGFAGRTFVLPVLGSRVFSKKGITKREFHGTLWDTGLAVSKMMEIHGELMSVSIRTNLDKLGCGGYYTSVSLKDKLSHVLNFADAQMNSVITFEDTK